MSQTTSSTDMDEQEYRDKIRHYRDSDGLVTPIPHPGTSPNGSGNGLLYTSIEMLMLQSNLWLNMKDRDRLAHIAMDSMVKTGLLKRGPHHHDQQAHDDYVALTCALWCLCFEHLSESIYNYGENNPVKTPWGISLSYYYNNVTPGTFYHQDGRNNWSAWLGRMPQVVAHIQLAAGRKPGLFLRMAWTVSVLIASFADARDQDAWMLTWFLVKLRERTKPTFVSKLVSHIWRRALKRKVGSMRALLQRVMSTDHPIALAWLD